MGTGGPRLRHAVPEDVRGDRAAGQSAGAGAPGVPGEGHRRGRCRPAQLQDQGDRQRPTQTLLLHLPEDDRPRPGLQRHLRPRGRADSGGLAARLLCRAGHPALAVLTGARPVQGLHRDAQVHDVPIPAHHRDRAGGQAGRDANPDPGDGPHRRVRGGRALALQAGRGGRQARTGRLRLVAPTARMAARGGGPGRVPRGPVLRVVQCGDLRIHPGRRRGGAALGRHPGGLRLLGAHRGRAPLRGGQGQRQVGAAGECAQQRRRGGNLHRQVRLGRTQPGLVALRGVQPGP